MMNKKPYTLNPDLKSETFTVRIPKYLVDHLNTLGVSKSKYLESLVVIDTNIPQPQKFLTA